MMWSAIITVALQLLGWFLDKAAASKEQKKAFYEWVKLAGKDIGSVKLMEYGDKQLKWFDQNPFKET